jgi:hypothetical protein
MSGNHILDYTATLHEADATDYKYEVLVGQCKGRTTGRDFKGLEWIYGPSGRLL